MPFLILIFLFFLPARGEYRVFRLRITGPSADGASAAPVRTPASAGATTQTQAATLPSVEAPKQSEKFLKSTLDPEQYRLYYPLKANEIISYVDTWICRGRTGDFKELCEKPAPPIASTGPGK